MSNAASSPRKSPSSATSSELRPQAPASRDAYEQVRRRAYELYQLRGSDDGHALDDWLQAEAELREEREDLAA